MNENSIKECLVDGKLDLCGQELGDGDIENWHAYSWLANVRILDLSRNELSDAGLAHLLQCEHLHNLSRLDLYQNDLGPRAGAIFADSNLFTGLCDLEIGLNSVIGDAGMEALANAPLLATLEYLGVAHTGIAELGLLHLVTSRKFAKLRILDIRGAPVGPDAIRTIAVAPALKTLEEIDFSDNDLGPEAVGDDDIEVLLRSDTLPNLRKIVLLPPRIWGSVSEVDVVACREQLGLR